MLALLLPSAPDPDPDPDPWSSPADELALLVTYYRVTAANISSVEINHDLTLRETRGAFTDFRRLGFTITTEAGDVVSVEADRCVPSLT